MKKSVDVLRNPEQSSGPRRPAEVRYLGRIGRKRISFSYRLSAGAGSALLYIVLFANPGCKKLKVDVWHGIDGHVMEKGTQLPIDSVSVTLGDTLPGHPVAQTYSDSNGFFTMAALSLGNSILYARKSGYETAHMKLDFKDLDVTGLVVEMEKDGWP